MHIFRMISLRAGMQNDFDACARAAGPSPAERTCGNIAEVTGNYR